MCQCVGVGVGVEVGETGVGVEYLVGARLYFLPISFQMLRLRTHERQSNYP